MGVVGRPSRSTPRTECQKVLGRNAQDLRVGVSGEDAVDGAGDQVQQPVGVRRRAPVRGVIELVSSLTSEPSTASPEASCRAARTEDEPTSRDKTLSLCDIDDTPTPERDPAAV
jgi:hypothetical protein